MLERQLTLHAPALAGAQQLLVRRIEGHEAISELFSYEVTLYSKSAEVDFSKVLGQEMCVGLVQPRSPDGGAAKERFFHGYVASFASLGSEEGYYVYRAELRPHFWRLTRSVNCRAYQGETVPHIVESILRKLGITFESHYAQPVKNEKSEEPYKPWEYCVQYRESDFAFIARLLEHEGIHYCFKHEQGKHTLVLSDSNPGDQDAIKGYDSVEFTQPGNVHNRREESAWSWSRVQRVLSDRTTVKDYDFTKPGDELMATSGSEIDRKHDDARNYAVYDWQEAVVQQTGYTTATSERYARIRTTELHTHYDVATFQTDARGLSAGYPFKFKNGPITHEKRGFLVISTQLRAENDLRASSASGDGASVYECTVTSIDLNHPFRPARVTPKPRIAGPQSAIVAGPKSAKDHHTDQWGRVFVKFHWYRPPEDIDKDISCWIRVSQNSAGANWGSMFVPHIGQEVIVSFYEGDPDRPVVTGRVYNGNNKPPLDLPANADKSIIRDHASNAITFDATKGDEKIRLYSPIDHAVFELGTKGSRIFTRNTDATYSYDSKSYAFGSKVAFTKGWSVSVDRGFWLGVKAGVGASLTLGTDIKMSGGASAELKTGVALSYLLNTSVSWGYAPELKAVSGTYKTVSTKEAVFDSQKAAFVTGGKNDNSMLRVDDDELTLSFDNSQSNRSAKIDEAFAKARNSAAIFAGIATGLSAAGAGWYQTDIDAIGPVKDPNDKIEQVVADYERISHLSWSDAPILTGIVGAGTTSVLAASNAKFPNPEHPSPSAKVILKKDLVRVFAGEKEKSKILLDAKNGILVLAEKAIMIESKNGNVRIAGKTEVMLKSETVKVDAVLHHKNMVVMK